MLFYFEFPNLRIPGPGSRIRWPALWQPGNETPAIRVAESSKKFRKEGNLTVSLRERYQYIWSGGVTRANELRSKLKAQYAIPGSRFNPYVAVEVYTWDKWLKTRHYVGTTIDITKNIAFEAYYMYFVFSDKPAWHIIGLGLNINL